MTKETLGSAEVLDAPEETCPACVALPGPRRHAVVGTFPAGAELLVLSGVPTKQEIGVGRPFVGRSGHHLDFLFGNFGLLRKRQIATLSIVNCLPADVEATASRADIEACRPWVENRIEEVDPLLILTLGSQATEWALGRGTLLSAVRGHLHQRGRRPLIPSHAPVTAIHCGTRGGPAIQLEQDVRYAVELLPTLRALRSPQ